MMGPVKIWLAYMYSGDRRASYSVKDRCTVHISQPVLIRANRQKYRRFQMVCMSTCLVG